MCARFLKRKNKQMKQLHLNEYNLIHQLYQKKKKSQIVLLLSRKKELERCKDGGLSVQEGPARDLPLPVPADR